MSTKLAQGRQSESELLNLSKIETTVYYCKIRITPFVRYIGSIVFLSFIDKKWIKGNEFSAKSLDGANPNNFIYKVNIVWHDEWETETLIIIQPTT